MGKLPLFLVFRRNLFDYLLQPFIQCGEILGDAEKQAARDMDSISESTEVGVSFTGSGCRNEVVTVDVDLLALFFGELTEYGFIRAGAICGAQVLGDCSVHGNPFIYDILEELKRTFSGHADLLSGRGAISSR